MSSLIILFLFIDLIQLNPINITMNNLIDILLSLRNNDLYMLPYNHSLLFYPYNGPFYKPLWKLSKPYYYFSQYGFPNPFYPSLSSRINMKFIKNDILIIKESTHNLTRKYILTENFTLFDLYSNLLSKFANETFTYDDITDNNDKSSISSSNNDNMMNSMNIKPSMMNNYDNIQINTEKMTNTMVYTHDDEDEDDEDDQKNRITNVILGERLQPRMFLPLFIDIYRIFKSIKVQCGKTCKDYIPNYEYVLWMYNWVICTNLGPKPKNDIDGICPKICRPRVDIIKNDFIQQIINLTFKSIHIVNPFDVCSQLLHTISGSCLVHGNGVYVNEFSCQCKSNAYHWQTINSLTGCLLIPEIIKSQYKNVSMATWFIECTHEMYPFCQYGTKKCYQRLRLIQSNHNNNSANNHNNNELTLISDVDISLWPYCLCYKNFTGIDCSIPFNSCQHLISNVLMKSQVLLHNQLVYDHDIDRPLISLNDDGGDSHRDYLKSATGNWLCGVPFGYGTCHSSSSSGLQYYCQCNIGYEKDVNYSDMDNCWKQIEQVNNNETVYKCGQNICLNGGQCIYVTKGLVTYIDQYNNEITTTNDTNHIYNQVPICQCQPGYTGFYCELKEGIWSEWNSWSDCLPNCGIKRYRSRLRLCHGDVGCIGSNQEIQKCPSKKCITISLNKSNDKSIQRKTFTLNYYSIWFLGCLIPIEIVIIILGVIIYENLLLKTSSSSSSSSLSSASSFSSPPSSSSSSSPSTSS
ncbi:unnamed protein product [Schistosoma mattheei]|uniref:EGF-like domain-containing protein n=2 Tax=Schistosoma mattheei TaxID=31246 RepID=A0AA85AS24_9TREM|nr:unnamed protein product [Schistosoma mattheei]